VIGLECIGLKRLGVGWVREGCYERLVNLAIKWEI
jgi:hypothetical protein